MPLDPSIALQTQSPSPTTMISSFIDLGQKKLNLDKARATYGADIAQRQADSSTAQSAASVNAANVQPLIQQQAAQTRSASTAADTSAFHLQGEQAQLGRQIAGSFVQDPDFVNGNTQGMLDKISQARATMIQSGISPAQAEANTAPLSAMALTKPGEIVQQLKNIILQGQQASQQSQTTNPSLALVPTAAGTQPFNTNGFAGKIGPTGQPMTPPNQTGTDVNGNPVVVNTTTKTAAPITGTGGPQAPQMQMPVGENLQTQQALQAERDQAKQAALSAPTMHDINRNIVAEVDKGVTTGTLGSVMNKIRGALGNKVAEEAGTDYNTLGKFLERSALTASQSMGPHTNAGLDAQVRANGSTDYTPGAIRKIATLNDALTTGSSMYQQGLEAAIQQSGNVFGKRQFDQQWASAMNPSGGVNGVQALRLKNAVDNGDKKEITAITQEVGGPGSKGATALHAKLVQLQQLAPQGQ